MFPTKNRMFRFLYKRNVFGFRDHLSELHAAESGRLTDSKESGSPETNESKKEHFFELGDYIQCEKRVFQCKSVLGDGSCFFRAVVDQLEHFQSDYGGDHSSLRKEAVQEMKRHPEIYMGFFEGVTTIKEYNKKLDELTKRETYAEDAIIKATAVILRHDIVVMRSVNGEGHTVTITPQEPSSADRELYVGLENEHYCSLHPSNVKPWINKETNEENENSNSNNSNSGGGLGGGGGSSSSNNGNNGNNNNNNNDNDNNNSKCRSDNSLYQENRGESKKNLDANNPNYDTQMPNVRKDWEDIQQMSAKFCKEVEITIAVSLTCQKNQDTAKLRSTKGIPNVATRARDFRKRWISMKKFGKVEKGSILPSRPKGESLLATTHKNRLKSRDRKNPEQESQGFGKELQQHARRVDEKRLRKSKVGVNPESRGKDRKGNQDALNHHDQKLVNICSTFHPIREWIRNILCVIGVVIFAAIIAGDLYRSAFSSRC